MTSKEAYYILIQAWHGSKDNGDYPSFDDINEAFDTLKQDLKRLETLEETNTKYAKFIDDFQSKNMLLTKQNEKLKKAIEYEIELLIERRFNAYACDNYEVYNVIDAIIEELKEVLNDE